MSYDKFYNKYSSKNWAAKYSDGFTANELDCIALDILDEFPKFAYTDDETGNIYILANEDGTKVGGHDKPYVTMVLAEIKKSGSIRIYGEYPLYTEKIGETIMNIYHKYADNK